MDAQTTKSAAEAARVRQFQRNKWLFSLGGIGRDMSYALVGTFLLTYLQFGVSLSLAQFSVLAILIGVLGRIWDAVNDPLMGSIIENTNLKWGRYKPWIFIGSLLTGVFILGMFQVRFAGWGFVVYMVVLYLLWESAYTMNDIGYWSMLPSLTSKKSERDSLSMLTVAFAAVGAILTNAIFSLFSAGNMVQTYTRWSFIIVLIFIGCQTMTAFGCKETALSKIPKQEGKVSIKQIVAVLKRNRQALWCGLSLLFSYISNGLLITLAYNLYYVEVGYDGNVFFFVAVYGVANVLANFFYPTLAKRFSRKFILTLTAIVASIGYVFIFCLGWFDFLPFNIGTFSVFGFCVFASQTLFYMTSIVNFANCIEYNEYITGERNEAIISTIRPFVAKMSDAIKYAVQLLVLVVSGIYLISQSIAAIETQKNFFSDAENPAVQIVYIEQVQSYLDRLEAGEDAEALQKELDGYEALASFQLEVEQLKAVGDCHVIATLPEEKEGTDLGKLRDLDVTTLSRDGSYDYTLAISGKGFNAGNENFKDVVFGNIGARLILRASVTLLPIVFLLGALWCQRKKFIIDEDFYEQMLAELETRREAVAVGTAEAE